MTGACAGDPFFEVDETDNTVRVVHVILCGGGTSLNGPGVLSIFEFRAVGEGTSPLVLTTNPDSCFADGGGR